MYGWGDITREECQSERDRRGRELAHYTPAEPPHDRLGVMAHYLASLPAAWQDATP